MELTKYINALEAWENCTLEYLVCFALNYYGCNKEIKKSFEYLIWVAALLDVLFDPFLTLCYKNSTINHTHSSSKLIKFENAWSSTCVITLLAKSLQLI